MDTKDLVKLGRGPHDWAFVNGEVLAIKWNYNASVCMNRTSNQWILSKRSTGTHGWRRSTSRYHSQYHIKISIVKTNELVVSIFMTTLSPNAALVWKEKWRWSLFLDVIITPSWTHGAFIGLFRVLRWISFNFAEKSLSIACNLNPTLLIKMHITNLWSTIEYPQYSVQCFVKESTCGCIFTILLYVLYPGQHGSGSKEHKYSLFFVWITGTSHLKLLHQIFLGPLVNWFVKIASKDFIFKKFGFWCSEAITHLPPTPEIFINE